MKRLKNAQISTKLFLSFGVVLALIAILGAVAIFDFARMAGNTADITGNWMPSIGRLGELNAQAANVRIQQLRVIIARTPEEAQAHMREIDTLLQSMTQERAEYDRYLAITGNAERQLWNAYWLQWQSYMDLQPKYLALLQEHKQSEALDLIGGEGKRLYDESRVKLDQVLKFNTDGAQSATAASVSIYHAARVLVIGVVGIAVLLSALVAVSLRGSIRRPLEAIIQVFRHMASGKLDNVIDTSRKDEIGVVQQGLSDMQGEMRKLVAENRSQLEAISKAQAVIEFELDGTIRDANDNFLQLFGYSIDEVRGRHHSMFVAAAQRSSAEYQELWDKLRRGVYDKGRYTRMGKGERQLWIDGTYSPILDADGRPYKVVKYANDVTAQVMASSQMELAVARTEEAVKAAVEGNLTARINIGEASGDLRRMTDSINTLLVSMTGIVAKVKSAASEVHRGAEEISQGNLNLSQRTEEQASSLEETASSMEEMTDTVKQTADNAAQANQLAATARDQAEQGGSVTNSAVQAMAQINEASRRIADIISVIDEIAFQTNLLALNAAVEAARAGEQGRGFAVVASEVRALAIRSATAAKEIKELIQDSVRKVEDGSLLVTQSGETLGLIVASTKKVSDIVAEIAAASHEQSSGIEQVNRAVTQMDQVTQQNAALVEQATAASQSVADQARLLNSVIAAYHVGDFVAAENEVAPVLQARSAPQKERRSGRRPWANRGNTALAS